MNARPVLTIRHSGPVRQDKLFSICYRSPMPNAIRSVFAVVFGYIVMIVVVIPLTLIAVKAFGVHSGHPAPSYLVYNVAASLLAAFAGGWVAGRIAPSRRVAHGIALGLLVLVMAWLSYRHYAGQQPFWYQRLLIVAPAALAILGAWSAKRSTDIGRTDE